MRREINFFNDKYVFFHDTYGSSRSLRVCRISNIVDSTSNLINFESTASLVAGPPLLSKLDIRSMHVTYDFSNFIDF